jgi:hypothetical protein
VKNESEEKRHRPRRAVWAAAAGIGFGAGFGLFFARVKAYLRMVDDVNAIKANIARAERAEANVDAALEARRSRTTASSAPTSST